MAIDEELRPSNRPADAGSLPVRLLASLVLTVLATAFAVLVAGGTVTSVSAPAFVRAPLGAEGGDGRFEPTSGIGVELGRSGYAVHGAAGEAALSTEDAAGGDWRHFERGAVRSTAFGSETVVVTPTRTEQFLSVGKRQGARTWRWRLDPGTAKPRLRDDGSISLAAGAGSAGLRVAPVAILDGRGRDVTPPDLRWGLDRSSGDWHLTLALDDSKLPLPYVIDPAVDYPATQYLRSTASTTQTAVTDYAILTASGTVNTTAVTITTGTASSPAFIQFRPATAPFATRATPSTTPDGRGWIVDAGGTATPNDTVIPAGNWTLQVPPTRTTPPPAGR